MENFNFNRDFFEGCAALGDKDGAALAWALIRYGYEGTEPDGLKPALVAAFNFARGRVDAMRRGAQGGKSRKTIKVPRNVARATEDPSEVPSVDPSQDPYEDPSEVPSGQKEKEKEKEKEIKREKKREAQRAQVISFDDPFSQDLPEPPTAEDVRTYFQANSLRGDPTEFFDHFECQGWVRSNGQPIADWRAQARMWSRKQVEFDQSKSADLRAPEKPLPKAENAVDWEAELAVLEGGA